MGDLLQRLRGLKRPLRISMVGAGSMGAGLSYQFGVTPGVRLVALADLDAARAAAAVTLGGGRPAVVDSLAGVDDAIRRGDVAVCCDGEIAARCAQADVFVEASSAIGPALRFAVAAVESGKTLVLMNSEIDLAFGPELLRLCRARGVTYTSCDGDQHGVLERLIGELELWGFDLVMAGNIKGFLDRRANPTTIVAEADKRRLGYRMCTAYTDGTKLAIEMALLANARGLRPAVPGMRGPRAAHVREALGLFDLEWTWRRHGPVVDYLLGAEPGGGVFAIGHAEHPYQRDMMAYYKMGRGPFYLFYRPYHLCHVEALRSIVEAALDGVSLLAPRRGRVTDVFCRAKRDLTAGETLDGLGGYACYGVIEACPPAGHDGLPICLAEGARLLHDVPADEAVTLGDVELDARSEVKLLGGHPAAAAGE
jgi:predicted homoserine dehydrogenase-like protein